MDLQALRGSTLSSGAESRTLKSRDAACGNASQQELRPQQSASRDSPFTATATRTNLIRAQQPPADLVLSLASLYFRHIHPWFPFLNVHRVLAEMATMDDPTLLHLAVFGASLPFSYDSRLDKKSSDAFWKYSKRRIMLEAMEEPSYSSLEALTILVLDISGMTHGPQVWGPMALAIKHSVHLRSVRGHVLRTSSSGTDCEPPRDDESIYRERLFWAIYALDCYVTITTAQRSQLTEEHVQHFLGTRDGVWKEQTLAQMTANTVFRYQLDLCDLSRLVHCVYLEYTELEEHGENVLAWFAQFQAIAPRLNDWANLTLPASIGLSPSQSPSTRDISSFTMLHLYIHGLTIHLHGLMAYPAVDSLKSPTYESARAESQSYCRVSINSLTRIMVQLSDQMTDKLGWPAAWSAWVAARYLLLEASYGSELKNDPYHVLSQFIDKMSTHWQVVGKYRRLLHRAVSELTTSEPESALPEGTRVLPAIRDFRVPLSDLEDRFRADPMLLADVGSRIGRSPGLTLPVGGFESEELSGMAVAQDRIYDTEYALAGGPACDQWFATPLFGSSAYQTHLFLAPSDSSASAYTLG
ncbi:hypothetical protein ASPCAL06023 [Aspergillus calidoustus]|uniref:Xylanolytic transcriptional activator regulatory domain-containing protein n=1 Tax=Aspergillus calidoustus TaxID=454130 RepID=A0A0U5FZY7_ASPCI|nr:hypothetical protein ASPCAL06023 [Aspergillus calidoustus]